MGLREAALAASRFLIDQPDHVRGSYRTLPAEALGGGRRARREADGSMAGSFSSLPTVSGMMDGLELGQDAEVDADAEADAEAAADEGKEYRLALTVAVPPHAPGRPLPATVADLAGGGEQRDGPSSLSSGLRPLATAALGGALRYLSRHFPGTGLGPADLVPTPGAWSLRPRLGGLGGLPVAAAAGEDPTIPPHLRALGYRYGYGRRCDVMLAPGAPTASPWYGNTSAVATLELRYCSRHPVAVGGGSGDSGGGGGGGGGARHHYLDSLLLYAVSAEHRTHVPHRTRMGVTVAEEVRAATQVAMRDGGKSDRDGIGGGWGRGTAEPSSGPLMSGRTLRPAKTKAQQKDDLVWSVEEMLAGSSSGVFASPLVDDRTRMRYTLEVRSGVTGNAYAYGDAVDETVRRSPVVKVVPGDIPGLGGESDGQDGKFYGVGRGVTRIALVLSDDGSLPAEDGAGHGPLFLSSGSAAAAAGRTNAGPEPHELLMKDFRVLRPSLLLPAASADAGHGTTCKHTLLLDPDEAGRVYVNGRFVADTGEDHGLPALFGYDFTDVQMSETSNRTVPDHDAIRRACGILIQEVLTDASQMQKDIGGKLLSRLINGSDPGSHQAASKPGGSDLAPCLESNVIASTRFDPVGISAKALATRFPFLFGQEAFPCLAGDEADVRERLGHHRIPLAVPQRVLDVLGRGGIKSLKMMEEVLWFENPEAHYGPDALADISSADLLRGALARVNGAIASCGGTVPYLTEEELVLVKSSALCRGLTPVFSHSFVCRRNAASGKFYLHDAVFEWLQTDELNSEARKKLLGMYIVQRHSSTELLMHYI